MGQYRIFIQAHFQIGFLIKAIKYQIEISIPFVAIIIGTTKDAYGYYIFGYSFLDNATTKGDWFGSNADAEESRERE